MVKGCCGFAFGKNGDQDIDAYQSDESEVPSTTDTRKRELSVIAKAGFNSMQTPLSRKEAAQAKREQEEIERKHERKLANLRKLRDENGKRMEKAWEKLYQGSNYFRHFLARVFLDWRHCTAVVHLQMKRTKCGG